jgi:hypothetical protein
MSTYVPRSPIRGNARPPGSQAGHRANGFVARAAPRATYVESNFFEIP